MVSLTQRDHSLITNLSEFGVLSTHQIWALNFKNARKTTMLRRLRILERNNKIRRIHGLPDGSHGWSLTLSCARELGVQGVFKNINRNSIHHDITLSQLRLSLKSVGLGDNWVPEHILRYRAWEARERIRKIPESIPDGIFTLHKNNEHLVVAVELEMTPKNSSRYRKSFAAYYFKRNLGMLWYLVPNLSFGRRLEQIWLKNYKENSRLYWSLISQVLQAPYDIELHKSGKKLLLRDILTIKNPAHSPAQEVSSF
jgi:hypothetical protein